MKLFAWLWRHWDEARRAGAVGRDAYWPGVIRLTSRPEVAIRELGSPALTPECFDRWFLRIYLDGPGWVTVSFVGEGGKPVCVDLILYDLDIEMPKEECLRLMKEDPDKFKALLDQVRENAVNLSQRIVRKLDVMPILTFSGCRGYQVLVPIKPIRPEEYALAHRAILLAVGLNDMPVDRQTIEPRRFFRLPFTNHEKTGKMCTPLDPLTGEPLDRAEAEKLFASLEDLDVRPLISELETLDKLAKAADEIEREEQKARVRREGRRGRGARKCSTIEEAIKIAPPCIKRIHERLMQGVNLEHTERVAYVIYLKKRGIPWGVVADFLLKHLPDANERICRYQVRHLYGLEGGRIDYSMPSCRKMREWGLCPGSCGRLHPLQILRRGAR